MSNWCENDLTFEGDVAAVLAFAKNGDNYLDFEKILPPPADACMLRSDWRTRNWGTPSIDTNHEATVYGGLAEMHFNTSWEPPLGIVRALAERFPDTIFRLAYFECGAGFQGVLEVQGGTVLCEERGPYDGPRGG